MLSRLRTRLTYANIMATVAVFLALGGGSAYAINEWTGANIQNETLTGADVKGRAGVDGTLTGLDLRNGSVHRGDLAPSALDACPSGSSRLGRLCVRTLNDTSKFHMAVSRCADLGLRLPTYSEGVLLSRSDIPNLATTESFWTDSLHSGGTSGDRAYVVYDYGAALSQSVEAEVRPVCATTPSTYR